MKLSALFPLLAILAAGILSAQKLETHTPDPKKVVRVETARDHLTIIELNEPVTMVAVGNQDAFTIERRENKVFVKPADENARTNLFIWTATGRYSYELVPAAGIDQMHFAIDQPQVAVQSIATTSPLVPDESAQRQMPSEMLEQAQAVLLHGDRDLGNHVEVLLRDLYRKEDRCYLRYAVVNHGRTVYRLTMPSATQVKALKPPFSLIPLAGHQLNGRSSRQIRTRTVGNLAIVAGEAPELVQPGEQANGWIALRLESPPADGQLVRLGFPPDAKASVEALLVLGRLTTQQEVAHGRRSGE